MWQPPAPQLGRSWGQALPQSQEQDTKEQDNGARRAGDPFRTPLFSCPWLQQSPVIPAWWLITPEIR